MDDATAQRYFRAVDPAARAGRDLDRLREAAAPRSITRWAERRLARARRRARLKAAGAALLRLFGSFLPGRKA